MGVVGQLGEGVTTLQVGQRVGVSAISGCGQCEACTRGQYTWGSAWKFYGNMHAEQFVIAANACHPLPDDVGWDVGVLITGDGFGVPYHTSLKLRDSSIKTVAIFGAGPIGLGNLLMQRSLGCTVIAVDISMAPEAGTTDGTLGMLLQTFAIMGRSISRFELGEADVVVRPVMTGLSSADFSNRVRAIRAGREAATALLPSLRAKLGQPAASGPSVGEAQLKR